jgi:hypothetical protein
VNGFSVTYFTPDVTQSWSWNPPDVFLCSINADQNAAAPGSHVVTTMFDAMDYNDVEVDPTGTVVTYPLAETLPPGQYAIVVQSWSPTSMTLAAGPSGTDTLWDSTQNQTLATFDVQASGTPFANPLNAGTIGASVQDQTGILAAPGNPNGYALYKIHLDQSSTLWRLGMQLDPVANEPGFGLSLSLFDSTGTVLGTCDSGSGMPGSPGSPYLYAGLKPGDYYVGVSGAGNLPGQADGYNPATGFEGSGGTNTAGGAYDLKLVAQPATTTHVVGFTLNWDDSLDPSPTGLTLAFSGPIDLNSVLGSDPDASSVIVVSGSKTYDLTPSGYDLARNQLSFVFDQKLPPGQYALELPAQGGLTDLAGQPPVASPWPPGVLATWTVAPRTTAASATDMGALYPGQTGGASRTATAAGADPAVFRVVLPVSGFYSLQTTVDQGSVAITQLGSAGLKVLDSHDAAAPNALDFYLNEGVYL